MFIFSTWRCSHADYSWIKRFCGQKIGIGSQFNAVRDSSSHSPLRLILLLSITCHGWSFVELLSATILATDMFRYANVLFGHDTGFESWLWVWEAELFPVFFHGGLFMRAMNSESKWVSVFSRVLLSRNGAPSRFGNDISQIALLVEFQTKDRLRFKVGKSQKQTKSATYLRLHSLLRTCLWFYLFVFGNRLMILTTDDLKYRSTSHPLPLLPPTPAMTLNSGKIHLSVLKSLEKPQEPCCEYKIYEAGPGEGGCIRKRQSWDERYTSCNIAWISRQ